MKFYKGKDLFNLLAIPSLQRGWYIAAAFLLVLLVIGLAIPEISTKDAVVQDSEKITAPLPIMLPFNADSPEKLDDDAKHIFTFTMHHSSWETNNYHINPDDCLRSLYINGKKVNLSLYSSVERCNVTHGFSIDLGGYLQNGDNKIIAEVSDIQFGSYGFNIYPEYIFFGSEWFYKIIFCSLLILLCARICTDKNARKNPWFVFLCLASFAVALRLPFFFRASTWDDESTFINMGNHILQGHLPYVELWDNKPPLLFYAYAALIYISGKDLAVLHFLGSLLVAATAFISYLIGAKLLDKKAGWFVGILYCVFSSVNNPDHGLMSDHLAILPIAFAFWILINHKNNFLKPIFIGLLIGTSAMVLTSYWLQIAVFSLIGLIISYPKIKRSLIDAVIITICSFIPFIIFLLIFAAHQQAEVLWRSVVSSGLSHTHMNSNSTLYGFANTLLYKLYDANFAWKVMLGGSATLPYFLSFVGLFLCLTPFCKISRKYCAILFLLYLSLHWGAALRTKEGFWQVHYLGLAWHNCLIAGLVLSHLINRKNILAMLASIYFTYTAINPFFYSFSDLSVRLAHKLPLKDDEFYNIAATINNSSAPHQFIFTCRKEQILYYLTDSDFPLQIAQPAIIEWSVLPEMAYNRPISVKEIFSEVKKYKPAYIIGPKGDSCFINFGDEYMENYNLIYSADNLELWQIKSAEELELLKQTAAKSRSLSQQLLSNPPRN
jgi:hypothetical protein